MVCLACDAIVLRVKAWVRQSVSTSGSSKMLFSLLTDTLADLLLGGGEISPCETNTMTGLKKRKVFLLTFEVGTDEDLCVLKSGREF